MAQFHNIKFLHEVEGLSQREIVRKLGISRNTVSKYLKAVEIPTTVQRKKFTAILKNIRMKPNEFYQLLINGWKMILNVGESKIIQLLECIKD